MRVDVKAEIELPSLPNFFRLSDGQAIPISALPEAELRRIGRAWTEELVRRAITLEAESAKGQK